MNLFEIYNTMLNKYDYNEYIRLATAKGWPVVPKQVFATQLGLYLVACNEHPNSNYMDAYYATYNIQKQSKCCGGSNNVL